VLFYLVAMKPYQNVRVYFKGEEEEEEEAGK
jgi:hypothetical protein